MILPGAVFYPQLLSEISRHGRVLGYDMRNRGRSPLIVDDNKLQRGIPAEVEDLEAVAGRSPSRRFTIVAHSYMALTAMLYATRHPGRIERMVLIDPLGPVPAWQYRPEFSYRATAAPHSPSPAESPCRAFWQEAYRSQVFHQERAGQAYPDLCGYRTEQPDRVRQTLRYMLGSAARIRLTPGELAGATFPILIIHGREDAVVPFGAAMDWSANLPDARLLLLSQAGHAPWADQPSQVASAIRAFLAGRWPEGAHRVESLPFPSALSSDPA